MDIARNQAPNSNNLKRYRRLMGYTQKDVAVLLGLKSSNRISNWEQGKAVPNIVNLIDLSILYSTLPAELYSDLYKARRAKIWSAKERFKNEKNNSPSFYDDS
jgi:transcriptional regulator with XRE-family HTH domain